MFEKGAVVFGEDFCLANARAAGLNFGVFEKEGGFATGKRFDFFFDVLLALEVDFAVERVHFLVL